jgi:hypothetical protein
LAAVLCFVFFYFAFAGAGSWSVDDVLAGSRRRRLPEGELSRS